MCFLSHFLPKDMFKCYTVGLYVNGMFCLVWLYQVFKWWLPNYKGWLMCPTNDHKINFNLFFRVMTSLLFFDFAMTAVPDVASHVRWLGAPLLGPCQGRGRGGTLAGRPGAGSRARLRGRRVGRHLPRRWGRWGRGALLPRRRVSSLSLILWAEGGAVGLVCAGEREKKVAVIGNKIIYTFIKNTIWGSLNSWSPV